MNTVHVPILLEPIVRALVEPFQGLSEPAWLVDCTLGGGGHTAAFLKALPNHHVLAIDQDPHAIEAAGIRFAPEIASGRLELAHCRFSEIESLLETRRVFALMADLGFSSDQLEDPKRGLSFQSEGPLDMRLDPTRGLSARDFLSKVGQKELEDILYNYGEERFSRRIAASILESRREGRLPATTGDLVGLVVRAVPASARHGRIHVATRTFQALRIAVNQELEELDCLLSRVILKVQRGGRVAILSFHSLEDRKVKQAFRGSDSFEPLTKKPIEVDEAEVEKNPRARSAKLRIAQKI